MSQSHSSLHHPKRFYDVVNVAAAAAGFAVQLDGRTPRSPARRALVFPTEALARLIAAEWAAQGEWVEFARMPATRLAHTALDAAPEARAAMVAEVARRAGVDVICYFAEGPGSLVARQEAGWGPWLDWAKADLGVSLDRAVGILHRPQSPESLARVAEIAATMDDFSLAGLAMATGLFGSAILALALVRRRLSGAAAFAASQIDEAFQIERWGEDAEAAHRAAALAADADMLDAWFEALTSA